MADYIDRQAAITEIQQAYIDTQEGFDSAAVKINVGLTKALHIVQDMPSALQDNRWIMCKDGLPQKGRQVLVFARSTRFALAKYDEMLEADGTFENQWVTFDAWKPLYRIDNVIAWMPLPEPYKRDES